MNKKQYKKIKFKIKLLTSKLDKMIAQCKQDTNNLKRIFEEYKILEE